MDRKQKIYAVGITGASGVIYGIRLIEELLKQEHRVHLMVTEAGWQVLKQELDWDTGNKNKEIKQYFNKYHGELYYHTLMDFNAPIASGSYKTDGMIVIPCSMGTLSKIAHGISSNLLERTADVMLKEDRKLIVVPRETPLNLIHLENMLTLAKAGAKIVPAMPAYYHKPDNMEDIINYLVGKVLDLMDISHSLYRRWGSETID